MPTNYARMMDETLARLSAEKASPSLLLHCCCAPCTSGCLWQIETVFSITPYFYNPNISPEGEYNKRYDELCRFIRDAAPNGVNTPIKEIYDSAKFCAIAAGLEDEPERGKRCMKCYEMRLMKTAEYAAENGYEYITTTLTLSPLKDADALNKIGAAAAEKYGVKYLYSDFKKHDGYKRSIELSKQYNLYRQNFCGCVYSKGREKS